MSSGCPVQQREFARWSRETPRAAGQLSPCAMAESAVVDCRTPGAESRCSTARVATAAPSPQLERACPQQGDPARPEISVKHTFKRRKSSENTTKYTHTHTHTHVFPTSTQISRKLWNHCLGSDPSSAKAVLCDPRQTSSRSVSEIPHLNIDNGPDLRGLLRR